jgi:GT2 family glycosyltransferase
MAPEQQLEGPAVTVCIANYNGAGLVEGCLESVLEQQCDFDFEVLVHDDCSTDGSDQTVRERFPDVRLLISGENVGFCRSNNRMADEARGRYLLLLNNDTRLKSGALETLYRFATQNPQAGVLTLPQYQMDTGELLDRGMWLDPFANPIPNLQAGNLAVATVMGSCLWISRELWTEIGGLPEWFGSMAEDMYLCTCARLRGFGVFAVDASGYDHAVGHSFGGGKVETASLNTTYERRALSELNKNRVIALCFPGPAVCLLALQFVLLLAEGTVLSLLKLKTEPLRKIYLPAVTGILMDSSRLSRWRRRVQASRRIGLTDFFTPVRFTHHKLWMLWKYGIPTIR